MGKGIGNATTLSDQPNQKMFVSHFDSDQAYPPFLEIDHPCTIARCSIHSVEATGRADLQDEGLCAVCAPGGHSGWVLRDAIDRAERGLIDADLGGGLIKQRVARPGRGRRSGYRTIIVYRCEDRSLFVTGFAKSGLDNIDDNDLARLKALAGQVLSWNDAQVKQLLDSKEWQELT